MKKIVFSLLIFTSIVAFSQEKSTLKSYEKFKFGVGVESMSYVGYGINTVGYKFQFDLPIYKKLGASISYSNPSSYRDYCDDIPVNANEQHYVVGLNYVVLDKSRWTISVLGALDIERTKYTEHKSLQLEIAQLHNEQFHPFEEDHNSTEAFVEVLIGAEVNYQLSERLQLNFSTRLNSYGSFRNSLSLSYLFDLRKRKPRYYFD